MIAPARHEHGLLERHEQLGRLAALVDAVSAGDARVSILQGPPGIGKTSLLRAVKPYAAERGIDVLFARGGEVERELAFGVVRQLLERAVLRTGGRDLLTGAAELAAPILDPSARVADAEEFARLHGLYWAFADLAARRPVLAVIDDAHWCDRESVHWIGHLARRLEGMPAGLLLALRPDEPGGAAREVLEAVRESAPATLEPRPLGRLATATLLRAARGPTSEELCDACHAATGGNPFLLEQLIAALAAEGIDDSPDAARRVGELGPAAIARATLVRLARLPGRAAALGRAVAVLETAPLPLAAAVAGLDVAEAGTAFQELEAAGLLAASSPLRYVHPVIRRAMYEDLPLGERSELHRRATDALIRQGAGADRLATHLLPSQPAGSARTVALLREAAQRATQEGATETAVRCLRRALEEPPPPAELGGVLLELGRAEANHGEFVEQAGERLRAALRLAPTPEARADVALELAATLARFGRGREVPGVVEPVLHELGDEAGERGLRLELSLLVHRGWRRRAQHLARLPRGDPATAVGRQLLAHRALSGLVAGRTTAREATELARDALWEGIRADDAAEADAMAHAAYALILCDELDDTERLVDEALDLTRRRGRRLDHSIAIDARARIAYRRGDLEAARRDAGLACEIIARHGRGYVRWHLPHAYRALANCELGDLDAAEQVVGWALDAAADQAFPSARWSPLLRWARARLWLARSNPGAAVRELRQIERFCAAVGFVTPAEWSWRSDLALALHAVGDEDPVPPAQEELELARTLGAPRTLGIALRAAGLVRGGAEGLALLDEAVAVLEGSPARLEHARALVDRGAALRRLNRRADGRASLRAALPIAEACGAAPLVDRAIAELIAGGARPRTLAMTGPASLTGSEQRICAMAAGGMTNREIAQALYLTVKSVETHLSHGYRKLGISSRAHLPAALAPEGQG